MPNFTVTVLEADPMGGGTGADQQHSRLGLMGVGGVHYTGGSGSGGGHTVVVDALVYVLLSNDPNVSKTVKVQRGITDGGGQVTFTIDDLVTINVGTPVFTRAWYKVWAQTESKYSTPVRVDADLISHPTIIL